MNSNGYGSSSGIDLAAVRGSTSILMVAPQMNETTSRVCSDLLQPETPGEAAVIKISYHFSPTEMADRWLEDHPENESMIYCLSITDNDNPLPQTYGENISLTTARAEDLTGIGMKINQILGEISSDRSEILVGLDSLDSMLMYTGTENVYRFIRTISNLLSANQAQIHFHIDPSKNEEELNKLISAINAIIEIEESGEVSVKAR